MLKEEKVYVLKNKLRLEVIQLHYEILVAGHCYKTRVWTDFRVRVRTVVIISLQWMEST